MAKIMKPADPMVEDIVERFKEEVSKLLGDETVAIVPFGSRVKGGYDRKSDYDILLVHSGDEKKAEGAAAEVGLKISAELGVGVEPIVASVSDFWWGDSYFIKRVKRDGVVYYLDGKGETERRESVELLSLSEEFLDTAKLLLKQKMYRSVIDEGYNAAELAAKALLLWDGVELPGSHGGIVGEFGRAYVLKGKVSREIGKWFSKSLEKRNKARYDPRTEITAEDAKEIISTAEKMIKFAKEKITK